MRWISDDAVARLREITELPDVGGTRYRIVREVGRGGMGVVYEADDAELERKVALKVTNVLLSETQDLRVEARVLARLEHPGIVPVHDAGVLRDGRVYYTMKLVRGTRLDEWSRQQHGLTERLRLFARICEPVAFAHANGVVHRDLKPENVMVGELGAVLVMDWGAAALAHAHEQLVIGTLGYMAPEQSRGDRVGPAADVFALGRLLTYLVKEHEPPRRLKAVIARATSSDPDARYADARQMALDIFNILDGEPVSAYHETVFDHAERWLTRNRVLIALVAAYIVMRVVVFFWMRL